MCITLSLLILGSPQIREKASDENVSLDRRPLPQLGSSLLDAAGSVSTSLGLIEEDSQEDKAGWGSVPQISTGWGPVIPGGGWLSTMLPIIQLSSTAAVTVFTAPVTSYVESSVTKTIVVYNTHIVDLTSIITNTGWDSQTNTETETITSVGWTVSTGWVSQQVKLPLINEHALL